MALTDVDRLRAKLGEEIPDGGDDSDTLFSVDEIDDLLANWGSPDAALGEGWQIKAAKLSHLVDTTEGSTNRRMSQAHKQAVQQATSFGGFGLSRGPTRIHRIVRT